jgi:NADH dehydrogenase, FAD-containing subunit
MSDPAALGGVALALAAAAVAMFGRKRPSVGGRRRLGDSRGLLDKNVVVALGSLGLSLTSSVHNCSFFGVKLKKRPKLDLMVKKLLVLGGGTGGLAISREVRERLGPGEVEITVVDMRDRTEFRPSYLYVAFGYRKPEQISAPLEHLKKYKINFVKA